MVRQRCHIVTIDTMAPLNEVPNIFATTSGNGVDDSAHDVFPDKKPIKNILAATEATFAPDNSGKQIFRAG
jgi:hypothetical protein